MNIKSKNGSITISGTDVKVGNDLDLNAKKDITIKASEENFTSSSSSSQTGIGLSADLRQIYQYQKQEQEVEEMEKTI